MIKTEERKKSVIWQDLYDRYYVITMYEHRSVLGKQGKPTGD